MGEYDDTVAAWMASPCRHRALYEQTRQVSIENRTMETELEALKVELRKDASQQHGRRGWLRACPTSGDRQVVYMNGRRHEETVGPNRIYASGDPAMRVSRNGLDTR